MLAPLLLAAASSAPAGSSSGSSQRGPGMASSMHTMDATGTPLHSSNNNNTNNNNNNNSMSYHAINKNTATPASLNNAMSHHYHQQHHHGMLHRVRTHTTPNMKPPLPPPPSLLPPTAQSIQNQAYPPRLSVLPNMTLADADGSRRLDSHLPTLEPRLKSNVSVTGIPSKLDWNVRWLATTCGAPASLLSQQQYPPALSQQQQQQQQQQQKEAQRRPISSSSLFSTCMMLKRRHDGSQISVAEDEIDQSHSHAPIQLPTPTIPLLLSGTSSPAHLVKTSLHALHSSTVVLGAGDPPTPVTPFAAAVAVAVSSEEDTGFALANSGGGSVAAQTIRATVLSQLQ